MAKELEILTKSWITIEFKACAKRPVRSDRDHLVDAVPVHVYEAWRRIFKDALRPCQYAVS